MTPRQEAAWHMIEELRAWKPEVVLVPAPEATHSGHMLRIRCDQPPEWYQTLAFAAGHDSKRRGRLKRTRLMKALERIHEGILEPYRDAYKVTWDLVNDAVDAEAEKYREEIPF